MTNRQFGNKAHFALFYVFIYSIFAFVFSLATNIISPDQPLHDGQTLVSIGNEFELGFFSPNGSNSRYVGLWYTQFPEKVVWVANRENPLMDSSGTMMIGGLFENRSNLVIIDGNNNTVWFALNETNDGSQRSVKNAELNPIGNLILFDRNGSQLWQGFDHPTDVSLPGMKVGMNRQTGDELFISSWKHENNPSRGSFRALADAQRPPQIYIWNGSTKHYRTGQWNGRDFIGTRFLNNLWRIGYTMDYVPERGSLYFGIAALNYSGPLYLAINPFGYTVLSAWNPGSNKIVEFLLPESPCAYYGTCGSSGLCYDKDKKSSEICECFTGYIPKNVSEWNKGNWKEGCERKERFRCERNATTSQDVEEDGFLEYQRIKLPDLGSFVLSSGDKVSCEAECLRNCSCAGYAFVDTMGCMIFGDLIDVQRYATAPDGETFYLRLFHSELPKKHHRSKGFFVGLIVPLVVLGVCLLAFIIFQWRNKRRRSLAGDTHISDIRGEGNSEVRVFSYKEIEAATEKFSITNKLGEGGFGPVFKGKLQNGQLVAVKRLSRSSGQGLEEFKNEVLLISKLQHKNLVNLIGFCIQEEEKLLVYEYMPNKSLDKFILGSGSNDENTVLDWNMRYHIIEGIARGILYLHRDSRLRIIHRDLKTSNILLDDGMRPKISDFGMARIFGGDQSAANTNRLVGT
ncbi:hypothetical protein Leryth_025782 [Lithospermum erythrorhizon]|nr:hypothetical protein Leryth_025782 [Lithospermum erythrorhizon]